MHADSEAGEYSQAGPGGTVEHTENGHESSAPLLEVDQSVATVGQLPSFADNPAFQHNEEEGSVNEDQSNGSKLFLFRFHE